MPNISTLHNQLTYDLLHVIRVVFRDIVTLHNHFLSYLMWSQRLLIKNTNKPNYNIVSSLYTHNGRGKK